MKISPQEKLIVDLLADGAKHCPTFECYMKDDRARISALRKKGFVFNEEAGYCTDKMHNHNSQVKLRQLISWPQEAPQAPRTVVYRILAPGPAGTCTPTKPCFSKQRFETCSCVPVEKELKLF